MSATSTTPIPPSAAAEKVPVLLLKTKSSPTDGYQDFFSAARNARFDPIFVPVLEHRFRPEALQDLRRDIVSGGFSSDSVRAKYGAIIFTSQRAVEAFSQVVAELRSEAAELDLRDLLPATLPLYVVGPATARGLRALDLKCPLVGEESGNGEVLAQLILEHYNGLSSAHNGEGQKLPILFLVGEQRRDIIPKTLQSSDLPEHQRSRVDEVVVYETGEMQSFRADFTALVRRHEEAGVRQQWVVVFSPTGCRAMLESLGLVDQATGKLTRSLRDAPTQTWISTIGPTTRDYLVKNFDYEPDVCSKKPSPEGVGSAIEEFMQNRAEASQSLPRVSMAGVKESEPVASQNGNGTHKPQDDMSHQGTKRKADPTSPTKGASSEDTAPEKKQKTLDDDVEVTKPVEVTGVKEKNGVDAEEQSGEKVEDENGKHSESKEESAVVESSDREKEQPSNILEKGIIYFFTRSRVGIDDPESPDDLQRSYFVLRPLPKGAKLTDGTIEDTNTNRLFALPKKVLPKSPKDRFMAFVEKANASMEQLKDEFFAGSSHETKTRGTQHQSPVTPLGEGVYAITETSGRSGHLAYMLTIPQELGEVQHEMGLRNKGSFAVSVKNPTRKGPANASLPQSPEFPQDLLDEFRGLAWIPVQPKFLEYANAQILLIGEGNTEDDDVGKALDPTRKDQKNGDKETPAEELEKLEHEDELRVQHLHGDDTVFDDLKLSLDEYPKVPTTW
ncbi:tetrapyrrole biosynthesis, uroporphyrinogen III synthase [Phyllosticta citricarpa]